MIIELQAWWLTALNIWPIHSKINSRNWSSSEANRESVPKWLPFAGPLAHGMLDLVLGPSDRDPRFGTPMAAILGRYMILPRAKGAPPWGDSRRKCARRSPFAVAPKSPCSALNCVAKSRSNFKRLLKFNTVPKASQNGAPILNNALKIPWSVWSNFIYVF